jgi:hypothetical protein
MDVKFTSHNIRLDDGTFTKPEVGYCIDVEDWFLSARRVIDTVFPGDKSGVRIADLGCLEGGYSVEFARMGLQATGLEVRDSNFAACQYVKERVNLPNLRFVQDDAWNVAQYGPFDAVFCCGLLYHFEEPKRFLKLLSDVTSKVVIVQTHFATADEPDKFNLSPPAEHEGLKGRWYVEYSNEDEFLHREQCKWSAWDNKRSFWVQREYLLQAIGEVGFDLVFEQFDNLGPDVAETMLSGYYRTDHRGTFVGIKTGR